MRLVRRFRDRSTGSGIPAVVPPDLAPLVAHSRDCPHCGEWLRICWMTELRLQRSLEARQLELARGGLVILLWPMRRAAGGSVETPAVHRDDSLPEWLDDRRDPMAPDGAPALVPGRIGYSLAADESSIEPGAPTPNVPELTLTSDDRRLIVRIFPNEGGAGATAVLVGDAEAATARSVSPGTAPGPAEPPRRGRILLRVDESEYVFDESGTASLPGFPAASVSIVIR
jgi:hypothetical protein